MAKLPRWLGWLVDATGQTLVAAVLGSAAVTAILNAVFKGVLNLSLAWLVAALATTLFLSFFGFVLVIPKVIPLFRRGDRTPTQTLFVDEDIYLPDLTRRRDKIKGLSFERCKIRGPAMLCMLANNVVSGCHWQHDLNDVFVEFPDDRAGLAGPVFVENCVFRDCDFAAIGLIGPKSALEKMRQGFR